MEGDVERSVSETFPFNSGEITRQGKRTRQYQEIDTQMNLVEPADRRWLDRLNVNSVLNVASTSWVAWDRKLRTEFRVDRCSGSNDLKSGKLLRCIDNRKSSKFFDHSSSPAGVFLAFLFSQNVLHQFTLFMIQDHEEMQGPFVPELYSGEKAPFTGRDRTKDC